LREQENTFAGHLDGVGAAELMRGEPSADPGRLGGAS
jgi:hypothetical protein